MDDTIHLKTKPPNIMDKLYWIRATGPGLLGINNGIDAFARYVEEAHRLWSRFDRCADDESQAAEAMRIIADPAKADDVTSMNTYLDHLGDIGALRGRHVAARLRSQLYLAKGRPIKDAALDAVREILLDAVGGESSLPTCAVGSLVQYYLDEICGARAWPPPGASLRQINLHLSETWRTVERAIGQSVLVRRERDDPPPWPIERFEASRAEAVVAAGGLTPAAGPTSPR